MDIVKVLRKGFGSAMGRKAQIKGYHEICGMAALEVESLRAELAEWKQEWQTMETAPKDGSRILLATPSGKIADGFWSLEYRVWSWPYVMVEPTHWTRSLPIPGRKGEGG